MEMVNKNDDSSNVCQTTKVRPQHVERVDKYTVLFVNINIMDAEAPTGESLAEVAFSPALPAL